MKTSNSQKRLREMMSILEITQTDIVNTTGVLKSSLSNWVNGNREPRQDQISMLADPYNINPAWLMGYDVPMFNDNKPAAPTPDYVDIKRDEILRNYDKLSDEGREELLKQSRLLVKSGDYDRIKGGEDLA